MRLLRHADPFRDDENRVALQKLSYEGDDYIPIFSQKCLFRLLLSEVFCTDCLPIQAFGFTIEVVAKTLNHVLMTNIVIVGCFLKNRNKLVNLFAYLASNGVLSRSPQKMS